MQRRGLLHFVPGGLGHIVTSSRCGAQHYAAAGDLRFEDVSLRYFPGGPLALRHISFHVQSCEKVGVSGASISRACHVRHMPALCARVTAHVCVTIPCLDPLTQIGIVGRTGSGKTTLLMALFRMIGLAGGRIIVDGQDVAALPLKEVCLCVLHAFLSGWLREV